MIKKIRLVTINDIKEFTNTASKYGEALSVKSGHYVVPACSLMSVISLNLSEPVKISFDEAYTSDISLDFGKWIVEE